MKHIKYIKEYFDSEELKHKLSDDNLDMKKLVSDSSIISSSEDDAIVSSIKYDIPYIRKYDSTRYEKGIVFREGYDYYIGSGESLLAMLSMYVESSDVPDELKSGKKFEDKIYQVRYNSVIYWLEGEEKTTVFENKYEGHSRSGDIVEFKTCKGMKELIEFIKKEIVPLMEETTKMFEKTTLEKTHGNDNTPPTKYN